MKKNIYYKLAEEYLHSKKIGFHSPGDFGEENEKYLEIIFLKPEALDPNLVIDPPDVRVLVNKETSSVSLIEQM